MRVFFEIACSEYEVFMAKLEAIMKKQAVEKEKQAVMTLALSQVYGYCDV